MLKHKLILGVCLIAIFISTFGLLRMIFDAPSIQSTPVTTVATTATPTPGILLVSTTPRLEPTLEPSRSTHVKTAATTATPTPSILPVSTTPRLEPTPEPSRSTLRATVQPTPTLKPLKSRVVKHQPNQFRKGALDKEELTAVKKTLRTIQWSRNSDPKAAAVEDYKAIVKECATSRVHDLLADLITEAASNDYQPGNEGGNRTYSDELISNLEARVKDEREAQGPPSQRR
jgi:hypothetical protein